MKKVLSFILALCMICTLLPATVLAADTTVVFTMGADGSASHSDGSKVSAYSETVDGYTLTLSSPTNVYGSAIDAKGNGCLKLGASSKAGSFSFTVPDEVTSVIIAIAKYKSNTTKISINSGATQTLTKNSADGAYDEITVDTSSTKTVSLTTVSGGYRAMLNSITFVIAASGDADCTHTNTTVLSAEAPSCTEDGLLEGWECNDCGYSEQETDPATGHNYEETVQDATCTETGLNVKTCTVCGDTVETVIPTIAHTYVDGVCSSCGAEEPSVIEENYIFSDYTAGTQYADNEEHVLSENVTMITTDCHFTTQLRIYSSSSYNGYAVIQSALPITAITVSAGNKVDTLNVYGCNDGTTWELVGTISVTSTSYKDYSLDLGSAGYKYLKLDVAGSNQVRIANMTLTLMTSTSAEECEHTNTEVIEAVGATCTTPGSTAGEKCIDCQEMITEPVEIPATGHSFVDGICTCGAEKNTLVTDAADLQVGDRIVIVAKDSAYAMSTAQNANNRGQAAVTKDGDMATVGADAQVLTLKAGMVDGTFALYTGEGYLYASSSSSNQLKTDDVKTSNGSWKIEIDAEGVATIKAQGDNTRNWMRYNTSSGLFACYEDGQQDIVIYKLANSATADVAVHTYVSGSETVAKDYANLSDAQAATKGTLALLQNAVVAELNLNSAVTLELNGKTLTADAITATVKDSTDGEGLVMVAQGSAVLSSADGQLLLWDNTNNASGYRAFNYTFSNLGMDADEDEADKDAAVSEKYGTTVKSFWSDISFTKAKAYTLVASGVSGLQVSFKLALNDGSDKTFTFNDDTVKDWAAAEENNSENINYAFYISVYGFDALEEGYELTVTPVITFAGANTVAIDSTTYPEA